jgi:hypothetical protein
MRTPRDGGTRRRIAFWVIAAVALLVAHDLVYLVQLGPGRGLADALRTAGHAYWPMASALLLAGAAGVAAAWAARLRRLRRLIAHRPSGWATVGSRGALLGMWLRLLAVVVAAFVVQESAEHFVSHNHVPLLGALVGPENPLALPVLAVITLLGAAITSLVRERELELLALVAERIAPSRAEPGEPRARPAPRVRRHAAVLATPDLGRAPPGLVAHV